ncbi:hypothetical protein ACGFZU_06655 [Streptomyces tendae]|uniref:hypothetical protein n=1 Tax=Streptomyces tendae TaxID=1932 RepID=UPI00371C6F76
MTTPLPDGPLVEPVAVWDESPAEAAAADRRYWDDRMVDEPGFEYDGERYVAGDRVRFPNAGMRENQARVYEITAAGADRITASVDGCTYQLSRHDIGVIGIQHTDQN